jgi:hypothetical protein
VTAADIAGFSHGTAQASKQAEPEAQDIALAIELFTSGSLNTFAQSTNVNVSYRGKVTIRKKAVGHI